MAKKRYIVGIIPARMGSTRFPGKPLAEICGKAMIYHVYFRSVLSRILHDVYVATPDKEIQDYCNKNDMNVVMTKPTHERASDRTAEAMLKVERLSGRRIDIVVMIQGDEPLIHPRMINLAVMPLIKDKRILVSNLISPLKSIKEFEDQNEVKVVADRNNFALYFSREPIPSRKKGFEKVPMMKQVCVIPFQRDFLLKFNRLRQTPLEIIESIDMLRCLENGYKVKLITCNFNTYSVDTKRDLRHVIRLMKKDSLRKSSAGPKGVLL